MCKNFSKHFGGGGAAAPLCPPLSDALASYLAHFLFIETLSPSTIGDFVKIPIIHETCPVDDQIPLN